MTFKRYLSVFGSDDKKHNLERKFGYKFRALESVYPNADINFGVVYDRVKKEHSNFSVDAYNNKWNTPVYSQIKNIYKLPHNYVNMKDTPYYDKFKHAYLNCINAQNGPLNKIIVEKAKNKRHTAMKISPKLPSTVEKAYCAS